jgi:hypothetical protein
MALLLCYRATPRGFRMKAEILKARNFSESLVLYVVKTAIFDTHLRYFVRL